MAVRNGEWTFGVRVLLRALSLVSIALYAPIAAAQPIATAKDEFTREAPQGWVRYHERSKHIEGSWTLSFRSLPTGEELVRGFCKLKRSDGCHLLESQTLVEGKSTEHVGELSATNPFYAFRLRRPAPDAEWTVAKIGKELWPRDTYEDPAFIAEALARSPFAFSAIAPELQVDVFDPAFAIQNISRQSHEGRDLFKVEFQYTPPKKAGYQPLRSGWALFDPAQYWILRSFEVQTQRAKACVEKGHFVYAAGRGGFPVLQEIVVTRNPVGGKANFETKLSYKLHEGDSPEADFRLTAFGFPEPMGTPPPAARGLPWYLWFLFGGLALVAIGWFLHWRIRRRALTASAAAGV